MPLFTMTKQYDDGSALTEAMLDAMKSSTETFLNTTKLDSDNIQDGGIDSDALASNAVTTNKINTAAITAAKLAADVVALLLPPGMVAPYTASSAPTGWLMCEGATVSRTTYANLFAVVGTNFGSGDGSTTFHLPDFRGRFLRGQNVSTGRDPDVGSRTAMNSGGSTGDVIGSIQSSQFGSHTHTATDSGHTHSNSLNDSGHSHVVQQAFGSGGASSTIGVQTAPGVANYGNTTNSATTGMSITNASSTANVTNSSSGGNETRPVNAYVSYIIKI